MKKLVILAVVILGFAATSFAQYPLTATASATATIKEALTISKIVDLNFGNIFIPLAAGTVTIEATAEGTRDLGGLTGSGTGAAAKFAIDGTYGTNPKATFLPGPFLLTCGTYTMSFTPTYQDANGTTIISGVGAGSGITLDAYGKATLYIGGALSVGSGQHAGIYKNLTALSVTIAHP